MQQPDTRSDGHRAAPPLRIDAGQDATSYVLAIHGEIDIAGTGMVRAAFDRAVASDAPEVVVDLEFCTYMDSRGVASLLGLNRRMARCVGRDLVIIPGPPAVQRVFEICDLLALLPFADQDA